jgi:hypothetical protein
MRRVAPGLLGGVARPGRLADRLGSGGLDPLLVWGDRAREGARLLLGRTDRGGRRTQGLDVHWGDRAALHGLRKQLGPDRVGEVHQGSRLGDSVSHRMVTIYDVPHDARGGCVDGEEGADEGSREHPGSASRPGRRVRRGRLRQELAVAATGADPDGRGGDRARRAGQVSGTCTT